jgi:hypothetical protein
MLYKMMCCTLIALTVAAPATQSLHPSVFFEENSSEDLPQPLPFQEKAVNAMAVVSPQGRSAGHHTAQAAAYAKMHELATERKKALSTYQASLKAPRVGSRDDHGTDATNYEQLYLEAEARWKQQKKDCVNCDAAEVKLIAALQSAKGKHTTAQTAAAALAAASTAHSDAQKAWEEKKLAYATKAGQQACPSLSDEAPGGAFDAVIAVTMDMKALAAEVSNLKKDMELKKGELDIAEENYDKLKDDADDVDSEVTDLIKKRDTACAGLTSDVGPVGPPVSLLAIKTGAHLYLDASDPGASQTAWPAHGPGAQKFVLVSGKKGDGNGNSEANPKLMTESPAHYKFPGETNQGYFQSEGLSGISGGDFAISVCATYVDTDPKGDSFTGIFTQDDLASSRGLREMGFLSSHGYPASDAWNPSGRISDTHTGNDVPSHVCWTISKWATQDDDDVGKIYINGNVVTTSQFYNNQNNIALNDGYLRVGHWDGGRSDMDFKGRIYNIMVWLRTLSADEVAAIYSAVGKPVVESE